MLESCLCPFLAVAICDTVGTHESILYCFSIQVTQLRLRVVVEIFANTAQKCGCIHIILDS